MKLEHIQKENCPTCGSITVIDERRNVHTNGLYNEYRTFDCGCTLHFSPNFKKTREERKCPRSPDIQEKRKKDKIALNHLMVYVEKMKASDEFKETIRDKLKVIGWAWK